MVNGDNNQNALPGNPEGDVAAREAQRLITLRNHEDPSDGAVDSIEIEGLGRLARVGIADRSSFYNAWLVPSGLEKTLVIRSSAHAVYSHSGIAAVDFLSAVYVLCYLRIRARIQGNKPSNEEIISLMCGEIMLPVLPDTHYSNAADSLRIIKTAIDMSIDLTITHCTKKISDYNAEYAAVGFDVNTAQNYNQCLIYLANHVLPTSKYILCPNHILHLHLAIIKRGIVSEEFLDEVAKGFNDELGITVTLTRDAIKRIYNTYSEYITSTNAVQIFQHLSNMIPTQALRIKLSIQQSRGSGLTTYMTIRKAIRLYGDFNWDKIAIILATDVSAYLVAVRIVGSNFYYGYNKDISQIASTRYKSLGYVAKELLIKLNGEGALARYAGWTRAPKSKSLLDVMIRKYINNRDQPAGQDVAPVSDDILAIKAAIITHVEIFN